MIENNEALKCLCKKVDNELKNISRKCYEQGRKDAFLEIAYSDYVIKEPFEKMAYEKGIADERERIVAELEESKKSLVGRYDKSTPMMEMPSYKVAFNQGIEKAIEILRGDANENEI